MFSYINWLHISKTSTIFIAIIRGIFSSQYLSERLKPRYLFKITNRRQPLKLFEWINIFLFEPSFMKVFLSGTKTKLSWQIQVIWGLSLRLLIFRLNFSLKSLCFQFTYPNNCDNIKNGKSKRRLKVQNLLHLKLSAITGTTNHFVTRHNRRNQLSYRPRYPKRAPSGHVVRSASRSANMPI